MVPHILGMKNMAGVGNIIGASNIAGASNTMGRSDNASIGGMLLALALQGTSNIAGARASASAGNNPGASRSAIANQPFSTMYLVNPCDNLRMLETRANMDAFGTLLLPQTALYGSNTIAMWRR